MKNKKLRWLTRLLILGALAASAVCGGWYYLQHTWSDPPRYQLASITRGELAQVVTASGQLNPVIKVQVGSQISGNIQKLFADFNSPVKEGQVIAQLDPATYQAFVHQAEGNLDNAKAALELAKISFQRAKTLRADNLNAQAEYDKALADLHQAEAAVKINEGNLEKAKVDLARCMIFAPIDGIVISRNVDVGQTVAASLSAPTLFIIANDLAKMQIEANVAEADIGSVEVGQEVDFTVDAFSGQTFHGKVAQIRNAPIIDQNVVTYSTIIEVENPKLKLKPGMTANVSIILARRDNVLKIANAALRFRPPGVAEEKKERPAVSTSDAGSKSAKKPGSGGPKKDKRKSERTVYVLVPSSPSTNKVETSTWQRFYAAAVQLARNEPANNVETATLQPVQVKTGINDGSFTEILDGLNEGDEVVTGMSAPAKSTLTQAASIFTSNKKKR